MNNEASSSHVTLIRRCRSVVCVLSYRQLAIVLEVQIKDRKLMAVQLLALLVGLTCTSVLMSSVVDADPTGTRCPPAPGRSESCVCKTNKGVIDLTVFSNKDGTAR